MKKMLCFALSLCMRIRIVKWSSSENARNGEMYLWYGIIGA